MGKCRNGEMGHLEILTDLHVLSHPEYDKVVYLGCEVLLVDSRWLLFDLEDKGDMFLRNVGGLSTDYTALHPRRENAVFTLF
jgi:alpha-N-acetylglucosamine transferase